MRWILVIALSCASWSLRAAEEQSHGHRFEQMVWNHLFQRGYTDKWDIPGQANLVHPGVPISVKCIKWKSSITLGDALRQRVIDQPFEMVVAFYEEKEDSRSLEIVALHRVMVTPDEWNRWWGEVGLDDLERLSKRVKVGGLAETQAYAREEAARLRKQSPVISINPKINKDQRRIQCSIPFTIFHREILRLEPVKQERIQLWDRDFPRSLDASSRILN
jgi:transposase-like protein